MPDVGLPAANAPLTRPIQGRSRKWAGASDGQMPGQARHDGEGGGNEWRRHTGPDPVSLVCLQNPALAHRHPIEVRSRKLASDRQEQMLSQARQDGSDF